MLSIYYQVIMFVITVITMVVGFKLSPWPKEGFQDENKAAEFWIMRIIIPVVVMLILCPTVMMIWYIIIFAVAIVIMFALIGIRLKKNFKEIKMKKLTIYIWTSFLLFSIGGAGIKMEITDKIEWIKYPLIFVFINGIIALLILIGALFNKKLMEKL